MDRLVIKPTLGRRLAESVAATVKLSEGLLLVNFIETGENRLFSERASCRKCAISMQDLSPQLFSFNNPKGACEECGGLGVKQFFDPTLVIADPNMSLSQGAITPWGHRSARSYSSQLLEAIARHYDFDLETPFHKLPKKIQSIILYGTGSEEIFFHYVRHRRTQTSETPFEGVLPPTVTSLP